MLAAACLVVLSATKSDETGRERRLKDIAVGSLLPRPEKQEPAARALDAQEKQEKEKEKQQKPEKREPAARAEDTHILHDSSQCPNHMKGLLFNHIPK